MIQLPLGYLAHALTSEKGGETLLQLVHHLSTWNSNTTTPVKMRAPRRRLSFWPNGGAVTWQKPLMTP